MERRRVRWVRGTVRVAGALALLAGLAGAILAEEDPPEEPVPRFGAKDGTPLPSTDELEAMAQALPPAKDGIDSYTQACLEYAVREGGTGAESFGRAMAISHGLQPARGLQFNRGTFQLLPRIHARDPGNLGVHLEKVRMVAMVLERRREQTPEVRLAAAYGRLAVGWGQILTGSKVDTRRLVEAAGTVRSLVAESPIDAASWFVFVRDATRVADVLGGDFAEWIDGEVATLQSSAMGAPELAQLALHRDLAKAIRLADMGDRTAGPVLTRLLPPLATPSAIAEDDVAFAGLYNRGVSAARRLKLPLKVRYRTHPARSRSGLVTFEIPVGTGWTRLRVDGDQADDEWVRDRGVTDKAVLKVWKYSTSVDYVDEDGKVIGGDNVGARLKRFFEDDRAQLRRVRKATPMSPRLSKAIDARGYEVRGDDDIGVELWVREWYFKSSFDPRWVLNVSLRRTGVALASDPEIDAILDSMAEPAPRAK